MMRRFVAAFALALASQAALAQPYVVTGPVRGEMCKDWLLLKSCSLVAVDAVVGKDGQPWTLAERFEKVSEYKSGTCWIRTKVEGWGLPGAALNAATAPVFLTRKTNGDFEKIDVGYIVFQCRKEGACPNFCVNGSDFN